ncbi:MAG: methylated-DNA--[protein]-cysteine S-methyltransferase [Thermotogaceae bacterium]|nr:methylated-DNA--[protein]-cysteine S-methyltransferase [Thermotogaceae bacterium]
MATELGPVSVLVERGKAVRILLGVYIQPAEFIDPFKKQLDEYFNGSRKILDFPVRIEGSRFQKRVWEIVRRIPYGAVITYGEIAKVLNTSPRAVGMALSKNLFPIYIPCHRVIAKDGLGGFSEGLAWKKFLLKVEGVVL